MKDLARWIKSYWTVFWGRMRAVRDGSLSKVTEEIRKLIFEAHKDLKPSVIAELEGYYLRKKLIWELVEKILGLTVTFMAAVVLVVAAGGAVYINVFLEGNDKRAALDTVNAALRKDGLSMFLIFFGLNLVEGSVERYLRTKIAETVAVLEGLKAARAVAELRDNQDEKPDGWIAEVLAQEAGRG